MISTKGRYAIRALADLAKHSDDALVTLRDVAKRQGLSEKYLQHIAKLLVDKKLITGVSGKGGGYRLSKQASDITVLEVLEATEGTVAPVACLAPGAPPCELVERCKTISMWSKYNAITREFFGGITIAELAGSEGCDPLEDLGE